MKKRNSYAKTYKAMLREIARLEFLNDQLYAELSEADEIFRAIGFQNGLSTASSAAKELYELNNEQV